MKPKNENRFDNLKKIILVSGGASAIFYGLLKFVEKQNQLEGSFEALFYLYYRAKDVILIGKKKN